MNAKKPSLWGTGLILMLGVSYVVNAVEGTVGHGRTYGFSHLELGIVVAAAMCGVAMIMFGLLKWQSSDDPLPWWGAILVVIAGVAVIAVKDVLVRRFFSDDARLISLLGTSWYFFVGGVSLGWAIGRLRKARAIDRSSGPDSDRQDIAAAQ